MIRRSFVVCLVALGCRQSLPDPVLPLTPTPDAAFRSAPPALEPQRPRRPPEVSTTTLANGVTVLVSEQPARSRVSLVYANRAAREADDPGTFGLAALTARALDEGTRLSDGRELAHLRFGGTRPAIVADLSGTVVAIEVLGTALAPGLSLLADFVKNPIFDPAGIDAARAELGERVFGRSLMIGTQLRRAAYEALTGRIDPSGRNGAGLTDAMVRQFHRERYTPADSALVIAGPVRSTDAVAAVERALGTWTALPRAAAAPGAPAAKPRWHATSVIQGLAGDASQARFSLAMPCVGVTDAESVNFDVLAMILANLFGSRAMKALRHEEGIGYGIHADCEQRQDYGIFWVDFDVDTLAALEALEKVVAELQRLRSERVTEHELALARARLLGRLEPAVGGSHALAAIYLLGLPADYFDAYRARLAAVDAESLRRTAQRYFDRSTMGIAVHGDPRLLAPELVRFGKQEWSRLEPSTPQ
ncbi:MAG TPA: pitrilysin family protein [Polyangiaceae bacterium]